MHSTSRQRNRGIRSAWSAWRSASASNCWTWTWAAFDKTDTLTEGRPRLVTVTGLDAAGARRGGHEGSTILVALNGLRLLRSAAWRYSASRNR